MTTSRRNFLKGASALALIGAGSVSLAMAAEKPWASLYRQNPIPVANGGTGATPLNEQMIRSESFRTEKDFETGITWHHWKLRTCNGSTYALRGQNRAWLERAAIATKRRALSR